MKVRRIGLETDPAKPTQQDTASALPVELVEEILLRIPPDEPAHLVRATVVCKAWQSIISDDTFRRRYRRFHRTPNLQGYIYNDLMDSTIRFVPLTSMGVPAVCTPNLYNTCIQRSTAMDCRHGRVLIQAADCFSGSMDWLIVWDPISGSQQHLGVPAYPQYPYPYDYAAAVLCAKNDCDHLDCRGGPFLIVLLGSSCEYDKGIQTWANVYSSETSAWSTPTTANVKTNDHIEKLAPSILIGDALYFDTQFGGYNIVKYDLSKHELSVMDWPAGFERILFKGNDGGLGLASMSHNSIYTWSSWQVDNNGASGSVKFRVIKLGDTLLPRGAGDRPSDLICMAEGTNTVFNGVTGTGLFTLDLKSRLVRKIGEETCYLRPILPYMSFYTPNH